MNETDPFERQIAEFVDGTLEEPTRTSIENRLLTDAEARLLATQYAHLDAALRASRQEPAVDFEQLAGRLSAAIAEEAAHDPAPLKLPAATTATVFWRKRAAFAAAAVVAATAAAVLLSGRGGALTPSPAGELIVIGPTVETARQPGEIHIAIGPSQALVDRGMTAGLTEELIIQRPSRVVISAADVPAYLPAGEERLY